MIISRYILEQSLSVDNLFVFVLVFKYFRVPVMYQVLLPTSNLLVYDYLALILSKGFQYGFYMQILLVNPWWWKTCYIANIESSAFLWYCWCCNLSFGIDITWDGHPPGKSFLYQFVFVHMLMLYHLSDSFWFFYYLVVLEVWGGEFTICCNTSILIRKGAISLLLRCNNN